MKDKKQQILQAACVLFNERGFGSVSIRQVAESMGMSKGNLAYHFANTEVMLLAIHQQMFEEMQGIILPMKALELKHLHQVFVYTLDFQHRYRFFFEELPQISRRFPELAQKHTEIVARRQEEGKALLTYFVGKGWLQIESEKSGYDGLLESMWTLLTFWPARQLIWQGKLLDSQLV